MTEERLYVILNQTHGDEPNHKSHLIVEAMKQAINEVLDEAVEKADTRVIPIGKDIITIVDKQSIRNLKMK